ncbi:FDLD family class I lanthipeptide [Tumebacillus sp. ITR2]|uniref:FDLD family class I lanthipeptide n=1 Tax=Tumebacillus amylolyticus TaxID=2801339 RepID=A0ABS1JEB8_9BACL|nr:FDLD family class I lanthipeptide [Tumebacillus amylolyticus]MBL0388642.1 FDLD family class I lanthipeptide [Tumebacillus amylolyticus]
MEQMFDLDVQVNQSQASTSMMADISTSFGSGTCFCTISGCSVQDAS